MYAADQRLKSFLIRISAKKKLVKRLFGPKFQSEDIIISTIVFQNFISINFQIHGKNNSDLSILNDAS